MKYSVEMYYLLILPPNLLLYGERTTTCGGGGRGFQKKLTLREDRSDWSDTWFAWSTCNFWLPSPNAFHCLSPTWIPETNSNTCVKCQIWSARSFFFSQRRLDLAFQFPFYRLTQRLNKTDISVSRNGKKCLFLHNLISKPRMNPLRSAEDTNLSHFPRNQLNFKWGMGNKNRPEKSFLSLWSVSRFRTRLPSSFIPLSVPRGAKARS